MNSGGGQGIYCRGGGMHGRRKSGTERADAGYISQTDVPKNERIHAHFFLLYPYLTVVVLQNMLVSAGKCDKLH